MAPSRGVPEVLVKEVSTSDLAALYPGFAVLGQEKVWQVGAVATVAYEVLVRTLCRVDTDDTNGTTMPVYMVSAPLWVAYTVYAEDYRYRFALLADRWGRVRRWVELIGSSEEHVTAVCDLYELGYSPAVVAYIEALDR